MPFIKQLSIFAKKIAAVVIPPAVLADDALHAGNQYSAFISGSSGRAWAWGDNLGGQLGNNSAEFRCATPVSVVGTTKTFCQIAGGASHTLALDKNGRMWAWGFNNVGQLGNNAVLSQRTPVSVLGTTKTFCKIAAGTCYTLALDKYGRAWAWGNNLQGQLGNNAIITQRTPVSVLGTIKTFCQIAAGTSHTLALDKNGRMWAWGDNTTGQLGNNAVLSQRTPVSVLGTTKTFCQIAGGGLHTIALDKNGRAWAWGFNKAGQLGDNTIISQRTPVSVLGTTKTFCQIAGGTSHTLAVDLYGRAWAWGRNDSGHLGDNSTASRKTPVSVVGTTKTFCQIAVGTQHTLALDKNGRAWAWGFNTQGQLGNNANQSRITPVSVVGTTKTFCQIAAGASHTLALDKNGRAWAWGYNDQGQLGNNAVLSQITPVSVLGTTKTFCQIAGGTQHTLALDKNGKVWAWGWNFFGQLGNNTIISQRTPVSVLGTTKTFCQIAIGTVGSHSIAIDRYGRTWGWGDNQAGQLGDYSGNKLTPVRVCNL